MGGAASHGSFMKEGLSNEEKARIAVKMQTLYEELKAQNKAEEEIFTAMSK